MEIETALPPVENLSIEKSDAGKITKLDEYINSGACVKALVDSGITKLPQKFKFPQKFLGQPSNVKYPVQLPLIDLTGLENPDRRKKVVAGIRDAGENWGFFQLVNHGVPNSVLEEMLESIRRYNEQPTEAKMEWQSRDKVGTFQYFHRNSPLPWRDTLQIDLPDGEVTEEAVHPICRKATKDYVKYCITPLKAILFELVAEALGLKRDYFATKSYHKHVFMAGHYYPPCPEPELTMGGMTHTDLGCMIILLQDNSGGFQMLYKNQWLDVPPVPGALLVNFGDLMQLITNAKFKSVRHQVLATRGASPRLSVGCFINPAESIYDDKVIGPVEELISEENPRIYKPTTGYEYRARYLQQLEQDSTIQALCHFTVSS